MNYTVRQMAPEEGEFPTYVLFDASGSALLHADQSPDADAESRSQIRLARPGGRVVATVDISPVEADEADDDEQRLDYAIIHEFAVYAIISVRSRPAAEANGGPRTYYTLEVEGETWLSLPHPEREACYAIYDEMPAGLDSYDTLTDLDLPADIGHICANGDDVAMTVALSPSRLDHTDLVALALAVLVEQTGTAR